MLGFAVIDFFAGNLGHYGEFGEKAGLHLVILAIYLVVVPICCIPLYLITKLTEGERDDEQLIEMCQEFFAMGFHSSFA